MPYLVIDTDRAIVSGGIVATQTAADTLAATDSAWTAHQGDVTGTLTFHANAEPGWFLTTAGVTVGELPFTSLQELKNALWRAHDYLIATWDALHAESASHPWAEVTTGSRLLRADSSVELPDSEGEPEQPERCRSAQIRGEPVGWSR